MANNPRSTRRDRSDDPPPPSDETKSDDQKSEFKKPSFWIAVATLLIVGAYTYFAHNQVTETQTANSIAKKALAEVNKPYVMYNTILPNRTRDTNGTHLRVGFTFTNFGNTPASFLRYTNCDAIIVGGGVTPNLKCNVSETGSDPTVLGPKQSTSYTGSIIKEDDLDATRDGKKSIYVMGYVTYQDSIDFDQFGNPEQRETRVCQKIEEIMLEAVQIANTAPISTPNSPSAPAPQAPQPATPQLPAGVAPIGTLGCPSFNCMDSACPAQR